MNINDNYKKCSICNKYIELNQYYIHKNTCKSQLVLNPNHQILMNYLHQMHELIHEKELFYIPLISKRKK